jgi:hypothetical protein
MSNDMTYRLSLFGTGHSALPTQDAFPRYGGFVGLHPLNLDVKYVDLEHIESVDEISPKPTLALTQGDHYVGPLGDSLPRAQVHGVAGKTPMP